MSIHEHLPPQARKGVEGSGMDERTGVGESREEGWARALVQGALTAKRRFQAGGKKELTGATGTLGAIYFKL
jgi:hypothetical protein